ncbi:uncharacterized protein LOC114357193 [Ostrinia furnacalis]|uniref:uncharacterized protein LOC114357193 n=1 Tax=Ostrinia furnacalis TaxID=93504 RepID=UPI001039D434|nr:uncharacterized protein LOC114357193 [Ostrinia furnacalis]
MLRTDKAKRNAQVCAREDFLMPAVMLGSEKLNLDQAPRDINTDEFQHERARLRAFVAATNPDCKKELMKSGSLGLLKYIIDSKLEDDWMIDPTIIANVVIGIETCDF